jgi:hypothetical protein
MGAPGGVMNVTMVSAGTEPSLRTMFSSVGLSTTDHECRGGAEAGIGRPPPGLF